jgi:hypothetical protein
MNWTAAKFIGGLAIVVISFVTTLYVMDRLAPPAPPLSSVDAGSSHSAQTSEPTIAATQASTVVDLPKPGAHGSKWIEIIQLNAKVPSETPVIAGQPILRLTAVPMNGRHYLAAEVTGLEKNRLYKITAWVKSDTGANFEIEASDRAMEGESYGNALFSLAGANLLSSRGTPNTGIEGGAQGWRKAWLDLPTTTGNMVISMNVINGDAANFQGDGKLEITMGGFSVDAQK